MLKWALMFGQDLLRPVAVEIYTVKSQLEL